MGNSILSNRQMQQPNAMQGQNSPFNPQTIQQFNQFRRTFNGNPQQAVMNLLRQGMMTNAQFQQLSQMANQFQNFMK